MTLITNKVCVIALPPHPKSYCLPHFRILFFLFMATLACTGLSAQNVSPQFPKKDTTVDRFHLRLLNGTVPVDVFDVINHVFAKKKQIRLDTTRTKTGKLFGSLLPSAEYTLQTGFAVELNGNLAFYTSDHADANISSIYAVAKYTQNKQFVVPVQANIWSAGNKYNIRSDWHFEEFPQLTYGLGSLTTTADGYGITYNYVRLYQTIYKTISTDFYAGIGYNFDDYYHVSEVDPPAGDSTDFRKYGLTPTSVSSGLTLNLLYDGRRNSINPEQSSYANIIYRANFTFLGSDAAWQSLNIDLRRYVNFPSSSKNILGFWTYDWFTLSGRPPYLSLPTTASDTYQNFGRGYVQGRFRGQNLLYLESEYRFGITQNGFLGGVVFANAQSFSEGTSSRFAAVLPGWGGGVRIKLNKFSKTNICLDYGFGLHGSGGIFANLGEVF